MASDDADAAQLWRLKRNGPYGFCLPSYERNRPAVSREHVDLTLPGLIGSAEFCDGIRIAEPYRPLCQSEAAINRVAWRPRPFLIERDERCQPFRRGYQLGHLIVLERREGTRTQNLSSGAEGLSTLARAR